MQRKSEKNKIGETIAGTAGAVIGGSLGAVLAGPIGGAIGGLAGYGVQFGILKISEYVNQKLSDREVKKIATLLEYATKKIKERLENGDNPRSDGFFTDTETERSADKEIFEGVIYAAQREHEEKKIPFLGNLYANIAFDSNISRAEANQLIKVAESLSYRQICIIQALGALQTAKKVGINPLRKTIFQNIHGYDNIALATEIFSLYQIGLISSSSAIFDPASICPNNLSVSGVGAELFNLMELNKNSKVEDLALITKLLTENNSF